MHKTKIALIYNALRKTHFPPNAREYMKRRHKDYPYLLEITDEAFNTATEDAYFKMLAKIGNDDYRVRVYNTEENRWELK